MYLTSGELIRNLRAFFGFEGWPYNRPCIPFQHKQTRADTLTVERIQAQIAAFTDTAAPIATGNINSDVEWSPPPSISGSESD